MGPLAEQKSPSLCLDKPEDLNKTVEDLAPVKDQLTAFVQEKRRREFESSLAMMTDADYHDQFNSFIKHQN